MVDWIERAMKVVVTVGAAFLESILLMLAVKCYARGYFEAGLAMACLALILFVVYFKVTFIDGEDTHEQK